MTTIYTRKRIRLKVQTSSSNALIDGLTGSAPYFWRGDDVQFELGLFFGDTLLDVSQYATITLDVKTSANKTGAALMSKTITTENVDNTLTNETWLDGTQQHIVLSFSNTETALNLGGSDGVSYWFVVYGTTNDSPTRKVVLGAGMVTCMEGGNTGGVSAPPDGQYYITQAASDSRYNRIGRDGRVNVLDFGADPTGASDCRNAFQAAFNYARANNCPDVLIPRGDYVICADMPIDVSRCNIIGKDARVWVSLPLDYVKPASPTAPGNDTYTAHNRLNAAGNYVDWVSSSATDNPGFYDYLGVAMWNGKTTVFDRAGDMDGTGTWYTIKGVNFDAGWGTVPGLNGCPAIVKPIVGVTTTNGYEYTKYQLFGGNPVRVKWIHANMKNIPGEGIMGATDNTVERCDFKNWGDHAVYNPCDQLTVDNCKFFSNRNTVGSNGSADFVSICYREAVKVSAGRHVKIVDNYFEDYASAAAFSCIDIESMDTLPNQLHDTEDILIQGNSGTCKQFLSMYSTRFNATGDGTGFRIKNALITNNVISILNAGKFFFSAAAMEDVAFVNNTISFKGTSGKLANIQGHRQYADAVKRMVWCGNIVTWEHVTSGPQISIDGNIHSLDIIANSFTNLDGAFVSTSILAGVYSVNSTAENNLESDIKYFRMERNRIENFVFDWIDYGWPTWAANTAYAFNSYVREDGTFKVCNCVNYNGETYRNKAAIGTTLTTAPSADTTNWEVMPTHNCRFKFVDNEIVVNYNGGSYPGGWAIAYIARNQLASGYTGKLRLFYKLQNKSNRTFSDTMTLGIDHGKHIFQDGSVSSVVQDGGDDDVTKVGNAAYTCQPDDRVVIVQNTTNQSITLPKVNGSTVQTVAIVKGLSNAATVTIVPPAGCYILPGAANVVLSAVGAATFIAWIDAAGVTQYAQVGKA